MVCLTVIGLCCFVPGAELPPGHPASETTVLQETLGHTPIQVVVGAGVGLVVAWLLITLLSLAGAVPGAPPASPSAL